MVFTDLPLTQEFKTLGMDDYLWVQALFNHEELERLRGQEPSDLHQQFLWRIIRMGVIDPEVADKPMDSLTQSMRHLSAIGMRLWKMWREAESWVSATLDTHLTILVLTSSLGGLPRDNDEGPAGHSGGDGSSSWVQRWGASAAPVRGTAWYSLATRGLVMGGGVGGGVGRMFHCKSYSDG